MKKRIPALLAACVLLISALGMSVFADEESVDTSVAEAETEAPVEEAETEVITAEEKEECPIIIKDAQYDIDTKTLSVIIANKSYSSYDVSVIPGTTVSTVSFPEIDNVYMNVIQSIVSNYGEDFLNQRGDQVMQIAQQEVMNIYMTNLGAGAEKTFKYQVETSGDKDPVIDIAVYHTPFDPSVVSATVSEFNIETFTDILHRPEVTPIQAIKNFLGQTAVKGFMDNPKCLIMILVACVLIYLAIGKGFEPLRLLPIACGMLLTNLPGAEMFHEELFAGGHAHWNLFDASNTVTPGLLDILYLGVKLGIYPCLIFFGVGAMTDFGPLIANPKSLLMGAAAQLGIFVTYVAAIFLGFNGAEADSNGIIGGADGPTAIYVTSRLAPHLLGPIAVAAYSYMALVPVIQPPIMKALTTKKERMIEMTALRTVSKKEKIIFPIVVTIFVAILVPSAAPLVGSLMLGNLFKECGVTERLSKTVQNELMNIVTIFLGISVGATATADTFLAPETLKIICMGVVAFGLGTAGGVLLAKFMNLFLKNKINPLIGSAGVSAVPMAARVSQMVGQKENPRNFLLMHAMGPNVAGVIGSAIAAGVLLSLFG